MLKIGITGGIGSGKSTVCKIFELLGVPVYYADEESKKLLDTYKVQEQIIEVFKNSIVSVDKTIDRKKLADLVFSDKQALEKLNKIVHPAVGNHFEEWLKKQKANYIIKEAAILFESGAYKQVDEVITIVSPPELKIKRTIDRNKITKEEVLLRMNNQMTDEEKVERSKYVIVNDEEQLLIPQVMKIHELLTSEK
jgi:dephospho-CoA kinase